MMTFRSRSQEPVTVEINSESDITSWGIGYNPQEVGTLCGIGRKWGFGGLLQNIALLVLARSFGKCL